MAKKNLGRLAGLAALAGAAYMASKGKDKGEDSNPTRAARPESTETRLKSPAESIAAADKSDKSTSISTKGEAGTTTPGTDKSVPILDVKPAPAAPKTATAPRTSTTAKTDSLGVKAPARGNSADKLANLSRSTTREAKTKQFAQEVPEELSAQKTDALAVASRAARAADARKRALSAGMMKEGGKVKKMASGGMTASKRADGIASRGKTNCKMY